MRRILEIELTGLRDGWGVGGGSFGPTLRDLKYQVLDFTFVVNDGSVKVGCLF